MAKSLSYAAFVAIGGRAISIATTFGLSLLVVRSLSPKSAGEYFLAMSICGFFSTICLMGINQSAIRFIARALSRNKYHVARAVARYTTLVVTASCIALAGLYAVVIGPAISTIIFRSPSLTENSPLIAVWIATQTLQLLLADLYRGYNKINKSISAGSAIPGAVALGIFFILTYQKSNATLPELIEAHIAANLFTLLIFLWKDRHYLKGQSTKIPNRYKNKIVKSCFPILANSLLTFALLQSGTWIIGILGTAGDIAIFSAANKLAATFGIANMILASFMPPTVAALIASKSTSQLETIIRRASTIASAIFFPAFLVFLLFPNNVMGAIFGKTYSNAGPVLMALSVGYYFNILTGIRGITLTMAGASGSLLIASLAGGFGVLILATAGFYWGGLAYCAWGVAIAMILQCSIELYFVKRHLKIRTYVTTSALGLPSLQIKIAQRIK